VVTTQAELDLGVDDLSSDDEQPKNTVGKVPLEWYADQAHIGYDLAGKRIARGAGKDGIDRFLASQDDPRHRWTIYDEENDEEVVLSKRDVQILRRIRDANYAHAEFEAYPEILESTEVEVHPLYGGTEPKRRFLPSKWEALRVKRIARAIRDGTYKVAPAPAEERGANAPAYLLWGEDGFAIGVGGRGGGAHMPPPLPAPKPLPPGHAASYNPPPEYLLSPEERATWEATPPSQRPLAFVPQRYGALRSVPLYAAGVREAFERCLDLYLCPRAMGRKLAVEPEALLPQLPDPAALRPFPVAVAHSFSGGGHAAGARARCLSVDPSGAWLATGGDDGAVALWELATGRCAARWALGGGGGGRVEAVAWSPVRGASVIAAAVEDRVVMIFSGTAVTEEAAGVTFGVLRGGGGGGGGGGAPGKGGRAVAATGSGSSSSSDSSGGEDSEEEGGAAEAGGGEDVSLRAAVWEGVPAGLTSAAALLPPPVGGGDSCGGAPFPAGPVFSIRHPAPVLRLSWHRKGDYLAVTTPAAPTGQVLVHQLSARSTKCPFPRNLGLVQAVQWHPRKPHLFVANQRNVRVYDLVADCALVAKLETGVQWVSSLDAHPSGEHLVVGSHDHKTLWFDLDLGATPYKTLRYHTAGVRRVAFHQGGLPLLATASDDGTLHVFHARVFPGDFTQNPVIVPVKILRGHAVQGGLGVLDFAWHPTQPWLVSSGADGSVRLWRD
jgi:ribosome biogenesis protein ERB1